MRTFTTGLGILALTGSLLVGCGGDDDVATALRDGEAPDADRGDEGNALQRDTRDDDADDDAEDNDDFCAEAVGLERRLDALDDSDTPTSEQFAEVSAGFDDLADDAPDDIADDMDTIARALEALADVFARIDLEDPASLEALEEESDRLEEEFGDLDEAGENVEAYLRDECGIELGGGDVVEGDVDGRRDDEGRTGTELDGEG